MAGNTIDGLDTYLVIGGEGFVGHALLNDLYKRYGNTALLFSSSRTHRFPSDHWTWIRSDLTSVESLRAVLRQTGAKSVFLTAASHFQSSKKDAHNVNVNGTIAVVEACRQAGVRRLVFTSSCSVIYSGADVIDADETTPYIPEKDHTSFYSASKAVGEQIILSANGKEGLYTSAIRPSGLMGPGDVTAIPDTIAVMKNGQGFVQIGNNTNLCDFDYVDNVTYGHILACEKLLDPSNPNLPGPAAGEAFFITSGEPIEMFTFARRVWYEYNGYKAWFNIVIPLWLGLFLGFCNECLYALVGKKAEGFHRANVVYATATRYHNIDKAKRLLGYQPVVGVDEGIKRSVQWYKEEEERERLRQRTAKHK